MKAAQITKTTAVVLTIAFLSIFSFAQNGKVWLTINNQANVPTIVNGSLIC
jgi:hypothetical protein